MSLVKAKVLLICVLCSVTDVRGDERNVGTAESSLFGGFAFESILIKLDQLHSKIIELDSAMKQADLRLSGDMAKLSKRIDEKLSGVVGAINEQNRTIAQTLYTQQNVTESVKEYLELNSSELNQQYSAERNQTYGAISEQNRTITQIFTAQQDYILSLKKQDEALEKLNGMVNQVNHNFSALKAQTEMIERTANAQFAQIAKAIQTLTLKNDELLYSLNSGFMALNVTFSSCLKYVSYPSGKYRIQPIDSEDPFWALCEQTVFGGGWIVFQHRYNGSVDFYRNWTEYRNGFGDMDGEFWLGLERLHRLTSARSYELLVELRDFDGNYTYARYDSFKVLSEAAQYWLDELGTYTGTASNAFADSWGEMFSTAEQDNDLLKKVNCASELKGGWWYSACGDTNLNGPYRNSYDKESMYWSRKEYKPYAYSRMMIREK